MAGGHWYPTLKRWAIIRCPFGTGLPALPQRLRGALSLQKMQGISSRQRHDRALRVNTRSRAEETGIGHEQVFEPVQFAEGICRAFGGVFAHWTRGKEVDGHQAGEAVGQGAWQAFKVTR